VGIFVRLGWHEPARSGETKGEDVQIGGGSKPAVVAWPPPPGIRIR
jgi:hypothetical protein